MVDCGVVVSVVVVLLSLPAAAVSVFVSFPPQDVINTVRHAHKGMEKNLVGFIVESLRLKNNGGGVGIQGVKNVVKYTTLNRRILWGYYVIAFLDICHQVNQRVCARRRIALAELWASEKVQAEIRTHYELIREFWGTAGSPDKQAEAYAGLSDLYINDERFTMVDGVANPTFAAFMNKAMKHFAKKLKE